MHKTTTKNQSHLVLPPTKIQKLDWQTWSPQEKKLPEVLRVLKNQDSTCPTTTLCEHLISLLHRQDPPLVWRRHNLCKESSCPITPSSSCNSKDQRALQLLWPSCYCYLRQRSNWISMKSPVLCYQLADFLLHAGINACPSQIISKI